MVLSKDDKVKLTYWYKNKIKDNNPGLILKDKEINI